MTRRWRRRRRRRNIRRGRGVGRIGVGWRRRRDGG